MFGRDFNRSPLGDALPSTLTVAAGIGSSLVAGLLAGLGPRLLLPLAGATAGVAAIAAPAEILVAPVLFVRNLTDPPAGMEASTLNLSALIGGALVAVAVGRAVSGTLHGAPLRWLAVAAVILVGWYGLSVVAEGLEPAVVRELARSLSILALAAIASTISPRVRGASVAWIVLGATAVPAVVAVVQAMGISSLHPDTGRPAGTFSHPNSAATAFAVCLTISVWLLLKVPHQRVLALISVTLFGIALAATLSLGGLIAGMSSLLALLVAGGVRVKRTGLVLCLVGVAIAFLLLPSGSERLDELGSVGFPDGSVEAGATSSSFEWRLLNWHLFLKEWEEAPVFGNGLGATEGRIRPLGTDPHNDFIRQLVETGILGLTLSLGALYLLLRGLWRRRSDPDCLAAPAFAVLVGVVVHGLVDSVFLSTAPMYLVAALVGYSLSRTINGSSESAVLPTAARYARSQRATYQIDPDRSPLA